MSKTLEKYYRPIIRFPEIKLRQQNNFTCSSITVSNAKKVNFSYLLFLDKLQISKS